MHKLTDYRQSITSQDGEDGIIVEIFNRLEIETGWCVEFGAWDGKLLSNTWNLWHRQEWKAILIEGNPSRAEQLKQDVADFSGVTALQRIVSHKGPNTLDVILKKTDIPQDFDLLSIDVDGNDYHIWKSLRDFQPKLVIIEYNATIPLQYVVVDNPGGSLNLGSSASALVDLAHEKKYKLICCTSGNLFFLRQDLIDDQIPEVTLAETFSTSKITAVVSTFSGVPLLTRPRPTHIHIDAEAGVGNQIAAELISLPTDLHQVVVLDKRAENAYAAILRLVAKHGWLRSFLTALDKLLSAKRTER